MIAQLRGSIVRIDDNLVIIDVGGVGYAATVSGKTQAGLSIGGGEMTLLTDMVVREDSMTLFGFVDAAEREAFRLLVTVQGVGAKAAMAILSVLTPDDLAAAIMAGDKAMVARADGVGPKLAQRVVNELKDKTVNVALGIAADAPAAARSAAVKAAGSDSLADAVSALVNLGYGRAEAYGAVQSAQAVLGADAALDQLITGGLKELAG